MGGLVVLSWDLLPAYAVRCVGCDYPALGGTGRPDDPMLDATYDFNDYTQEHTYLCHNCYDRILKTGLSKVRN